jgi:hypothetical protein
VEVNLEATGNSGVCSLSIQGRAGQLLPELLGVEDDPAVVAARAAAAAAQAAAAGAGDSKQAPRRS